MRLSSVQIGDIVECDVRGRRFHAFVVEREAASPSSGAPELAIRPMSSAISYRHVTARQVIGHWRKAGRRSVPQQPSA